MRRFRNRSEAGSELAGAVARLDVVDAVVLGLPRGGVVVAAPVADRIGVALDIILVRKLGVPFQPEFGFGALAERGVRILDDETIGALGIGPLEIERVSDAERTELERRGAAYRRGKEPESLQGRSAVIVDDGIATGVTMRAAVESARRGGAMVVTVAAPVGSEHALRTLGADHVVCLLVPARFTAVGNWYQEFDQTTDDEVIDALERSRN